MILLASITICSATFVTQHGMENTRHIKASYSHGRVTFHSPGGEPAFPNGDGEFLGRGNAEHSVFTMSPGSYVLGLEMMDEPEFTQLLVSL